MKMGRCLKESSKGIRRSCTRHIFLDTLFSSFFNMPCREQTSKKNLCNNIIDRKKKRYGTWYVATYT